MACLMQNLSLKSISLCSHLYKLSIMLSSNPRSSCFVCTTINYDYKPVNLDLKDRTTSGTPCSLPISPSPPPFSSLYCLTFLGAALSSSPSNSATLEPPASTPTAPKDPLSPLYRCQPLIAAPMLLALGSPPIYLGTSSLYFCTFPHPYT